MGALPRTYQTGDPPVASQEENGVARSDAKQTIVIVERNDFLRDCLLRSITDCSHSQAIGYATLGELTEILSNDGSYVVLLSTLSLSDAEKKEEVGRLANFDPRPRTMVLARNNNLDSVLFALSCGANGHISTSVGFEILIQALRFVGAGGTYLPPQCLVEAKKEPAKTEGTLQSKFTNREMEVIQAIRQGKPNKLIAHELNMTENTVKVHVRNIMTKLHAKNRTEIAMIIADLASPPLRRE